MNRVTRDSLLAAAFLLSSFPPAIAGRGSWTQVGPPTGGAITALGVAPSDPRVVYAGTGTGRVFRSLDGGASWSWDGEGMSSQNPSPIVSIAVDAHDPLTAFAAGGAVFKTTDGGAHWSILSGLPLDGANVVATAVVLDPSSPGTAYVALLGLSVDGKGVFKSVDGGFTWSPANTGLASFNQIYGLATSPTTSSLLYAATPSGIYRSDDGAEHWNATSPCASWPGPISIDPRDSSLVIAGGCRTTDGGKSWTASGVSYAVFDPNEPVLYGIPAGTPASVVVSGDDGATWQPLASGPPGETIESFAVAGSNLLAGFANAGAYRSTDDGHTWQAANAGLAAIPLWSFAISPVDPRRLWAGVQAQGAGNDMILRSDDGGVHWTELFSRAGYSLWGIVPNPVDRDGAYELATAYEDSLDPYSIYGVALRTTDSGASWIAGGPTALLNEIVTDPKSPGVLYGTANQPHLTSGVFKSMDAGATWSAIDRGLGIEFPTGITVDPNEPSRLYATDMSASTIWRSDDGGDTWQPTSSFDDTPPTEVVVGRDAESTLLAVGSKGVWRSTDLAAHWTLVPNLPPALLAADPRRPGTFYAATFGTVPALFVSRDAGATWASFPGPQLPDGPVLQLTVSANGLLYARTSTGLFELSVIPVLPVNAGTPAPVSGR